RYFAEVGRRPSATSQRYQPGRGSIEGSVRAIPNRRGRIPVRACDSKLDQEDPMDDEPTTQQQPEHEEPDSEPKGPRRLLRSRSDRMILGVAGGLGRYFNVDPVIFRIGVVVS